MDVGAPRIAGSTLYNAVSQEYTLSAGGVNMWATRDEFQFAWKRMTGDFILQARVEFLGTGVDPHRKAGWIVRAHDGARLCLRGRRGARRRPPSLQYRRTKGAITAQSELPVKGADVIQIERAGSTYTFSAARYGEPFTTAQIADVDLGDAVMVGLALCSHNPDVTERAVFRDVRIIRPAPADFVPYRDFIGSVLEILDVQSGHRQEILRSEQPFEAPNWTADGGALIYNRSGRGEGWGGLYRFDLLTRQSALIDTGAANRNNNDHVLSFDGTMLGISDQSPFAGGQSTVFTVPVGGGTPKRITTASPSYLHSWSPDGKQLIFTGGRNGEFDIYSIPADGSGPEVKLTDVAGLDDGPEFTRGRAVDLLQLRAQRHHAGLAHETGRQRPGAGHHRRASTTGFRTSLRTGGGSRSSASRATSRPPTIRTTSACTCASCRPRAGRHGWSRTCTADRARSTCPRGRRTAGCWLS